MLTLPLHSQTILIPRRPWLLTSTSKLGSVAVSLSVSLSLSLCQGLEHKPGTEKSFPITSCSLGRKWAREEVVAARLTREEKSRKEVIFSKAKVGRVVRLIFKQQLYQLDVYVVQQGKVCAINIPLRNFLMEWPIVNSNKYSNLCPK